jgi:hypothetical protein
LPAWPLTALLVSRLCPTNSLLAHCRKLECDGAVSYRSDEANSISYPGFVFILLYWHMEPFVTELTISLEAHGYQLIAGRIAW